mmetsp:Transcript_22020/g.68966  ORF Transcript_22020/g.68966 Transcript_22020/m.68966 type:complete len:230 (+) Transcript_22020:208-897(+)
MRASCRSPLKYPSSCQCRISSLVKPTCTWSLGSTYAQQTSPPGPSSGPRPGLAPPAPLPLSPRCSAWASARLSPPLRLCGAPSISGLASRPAPSPLLPRRPPLLSAWPPPSPRLATPRPSPRSRSLLALLSPRPSPRPSAPRPCAPASQDACHSRPVSAEGASEFDKLTRRRRPSLATIGSPPRASRTPMAALCEASSAKAQPVEKPDLRSRVTLTFVTSAISANKSEM